MEGEDHQKGKKERWYPGKFVQKAMRRSSTTSKSTHSTGGSIHGDDRSVSSQPSYDIGDVYYDEDSPTNSFSENNPAIDGEHAEHGVNESKESSAKKIRAKKLGKVIVTIHEVKYLALQSSKLFIELENGFNSGSGSSISDPTIGVTKELDLLDILSDLKIEFRGVHMTTNKAMSGYIILPLTQALSITGKPTKVAKKWYELYPYYDRVKLGEHPKITKFRSGYPDIPGSALQKCSFPMGFVSLDFEIQLNDDIPSGLSLYFYPSLPTHVNCAEAESDVNESNLLLTNARIARDIDRVRSVVLRPFACIAPFLSFPEVFPLILVFFFFCHSTSYQQVPFALFILALLNGIVASMNRQFGNIAIWNEPGVTLTFNAAGAIQTTVTEEVAGKPNDRMSIASLGTPYPTIMGILKNSQLLQKRLHESARTVEVLTNLFTFADPRISLMLYGFLAILALVLTILLHVFSFSTVAFLVGTIYFLVSAADEFLDEQIAGLSKTSVYWKYIFMFRHYSRLVRCVVEKTPDQLELTHRFICGRQIVKEGGAEMLDAHEAHEKAKSEKKDK